MGIEWDIREMSQDTEGEIMESRNWSYRFIGFDSGVQTIFFFSGYRPPKKIQELSLDTNNNHVALSGAKSGLEIQNQWGTIAALT